MSKRKHSSRRSKSLGKRIGKAFNALTEAIEGFFKSVFAGIGAAGGFLGALLIPKALTKRFQKATKKTSKKVGKRVGKITESVEKKFSKGTSGILASLGYVLKIFLPKSLTDWIAKRSKAISQATGKFFRRFGRWLGALAERYLPKWMVQFAKRFSKWTRRTTRNFSKFSAAWWKSRNYHALAWSTPAFVLAIPIVVSLVMSLAYGNAAKRRYYRDAHRVALDSKEFELASFYDQKLVQLGHRDIANDAVNRAMALAEDGRYAEAYEVLQQVAPLEGMELDVPIAPDATPEDENNEAPTQQDSPLAHLLIASFLLKGDVVPDDVTIDLLEYCKRHIDAGLQDDPRQGFGKYLRAQYYKRTGQMAEAIRDMADIANLKGFEKVNGELMQHYLSAANSGRAETCAKRYQDYIEEQDEADLTPVDIALWSTACIILRQHEDAERIARRLTGDDLRQHPELQRIAANAVLTALQDVDPESSDVIPLLLEAHEIDPNNRVVVDRLATRWVFDSAAVEPLMDKLIKEKRISPMVILRAGEMHVQGGRNQQAVACFEKAIAIDENCAQAYNNLAWLLSNIPPYRLQGALVAVNKAIAIQPRPGFFETRGQIHFKLEAYDQAQADLERALNGALARQDRVRSHETLARIYRRQGLQERADAHEKRAQRVFF